MQAEIFKNEAREASALESAIGNTPLIRLRRVTDGLPENITIYAKAEHLNPGGSVKDRAALAIIRAGEISGGLRPGKTILDATSGNTGIAFAMLGANLGYPVSLCLPSNASIERKKIVGLYGAEIIETDAMDGTDGAQATARQMAGEFPETYFYADQYNNDANWQAHYEGTAPEIWEQTGGGITHFFAGLGTSGTFVGTTRRLKKLDSSIAAISVQPDSPLHGLEGMKHMATARKPGIYDERLADENYEVSTEEAQEMTRRLAVEEGLFVGVSAGANVAASMRLARNLTSDATIVTILCDSGSRYLSEGFWNE